MLSLEGQEGAAEGPGCEVSRSRVGPGGGGAESRGRGRAHTGGTGVLGTQYAVPREWKGQCLPEGPGDGSTAAGAEGAGAKPGRGP